MGSLFISFVHGHRYFLTILDDFSMFTCIILLKYKDGVSNHVKSFISIIETQFKIKPQIVTIDNGPEFLLISFYDSKVIHHQISCMDTPQQNRWLEQKNQHKLSIGRALMYHSKLPKYYWSYTIQLLIFLMNIILHPYFKKNLLIVSCMTRNMS